MTRLRSPIRRGEPDGGNGSPPTAGHTRRPARDPPPPVPPEGGRSQSAGGISGVAGGGYAGTLQTRASYRWPIRTSAAP